MDDRPTYDQSAHPKVSIRGLTTSERVRLIELCRLDGILYFSISAWNEKDRIFDPEELAEVSEPQPLGG